MPETMIPVSQIVAPVEIARMAGVTTATVAVWHNRRAGNGFPAPIKEEPSRLYDRREIVAWLHQRAKR